MNLHLKNFPPELHRDLKVLAAKKGISLKKLIIELLHIRLNVVLTPEELGTEDLNVEFS